MSKQQHKPPLPQLDAFTRKVLSYRPPKEGDTPKVRVGVKCIIPFLLRYTPNMTKKC